MGGSRSGKHCSLSQVLSSSISGLRPVSVLSPPLTGEQREVENHWAVNSCLPFDVFLRRLSSPEGVFRIVQT